MTFGGIKMKDAEEEEFEFGEQVETRGGGEEELYSSIDLEEENEEEDTFPGDQNSTANENQQRKRKIYDIWAEFTDQAQFEAFWDAEKAAWGCRKRHATKSSSTEFWHCRYSTRSSRGYHCQMGVKIKRSNADGSVLVYRSINEEHCHEYTGDDPLRDKELRREIIGMFKQGSTPALVLHNLKKRQIEPPQLKRIQALAQRVRRASKPKTLTLLDKRSTSTNNKQEKYSQSSSWSQDGGLFKKKLGRPLKSEQQQIAGSSSQGKRIKCKLGDSQTPYSRRRPIADVFADTLGNGPRPPVDYTSPFPSSSTAGRSHGHRFESGGMKIAASNNNNNADDDAIGGSYYPPLFGEAATETAVEEEETQAIGDDGDVEIDGDCGGDNNMMNNDNGLLFNPYGVSHGQQLMEEEEAFAANVRTVYRSLHGAGLHLDALELKRQVNQLADRYELRLYDNKDAAATCSSNNTAGRR